METRQMTPYFSSTFSVLTVCNIYFYIQNGQNSFLCGPGFILVREIPQFWAKTTDLDSPSYISRKQTHYGYSKPILCFVPQRSQKIISSWTNTSVQRCLYPLFENHFLHLHQSLGQDKQNGKQTYCQLPQQTFTIKFKDTPSHISLDS